MIKTLNRTEGNYLDVKTMHETPTANATPSSKKVDGCLSSNIRTRQGGLFHIQHSTGCPSRKKERKERPRSKGWRERRRERRKKTGHPNWNGRSQIPPSVGNVTLQTENLKDTTEKMVRTMKFSNVAGNQHTKFYCISTSNELCERNLGKQFHL